jgi:carboxymethylenebutenolidase
MCYPTDETEDGPRIYEQQTDLPGSGRTIPTLTYGYDPQAQGPVVIVLHAIFGPGSFERDVGRRLAQAGFAALLPDLFCREGPLAEPSFEAALARNSRHNAPRAMEDIGVMVRHVSETGRPVGVIGFCLGGTYALFAATRLPLVKASVVYHGFPVNTHPSPNNPDSPIDEVDQLQVPLLGFFGETDFVVGPEHVRAYAMAATGVGKPVDFTIYLDTSHAFLSFDPRAPTASVSRESWARTLAFFQAHLGIVT